METLDRTPPRVHGYKAYIARSCAGLLFLVAASGTFSCLEQRGRRSASPVQNVHLFPADSLALLGLNLVELRKAERENAHAVSHLTRELLAGLSVDQGLLSQLNIDLERDIRSLAAALLPGRQSQPFSGVAIAVGQFDGPAISGALKSIGCTETGYDQGALYRCPTDAVAVVDRNRLVFGDEAGVKQVLDVRADRIEGMESNPSIRTSLKELKANDTFWAIYTSSEPSLATINLIGQVLPLFTDFGWGAIEGGVVIFNFRRDVELRVLMTCGEREQAARLNTFLNGILTLGRFSAALSPSSLSRDPLEDRFVREMLSSTVLTQKGRSLRMTSSVTTETAFRLINQSRNP